jgi:hypothetical protein
LVLKLITSSRLEVHRLLDYYSRLGIEHRCKVVVIQDFLPEAVLLRLVQASTYYVNTARAEGNCLPLMNYLAASRPAIAPTHTAMGDYFSERVGFPLDMHPEPAPWPQDSRLRLRTTWQRLVWPSLVQQFRESYAIAKRGLARYHILAQEARDHLQQWASYEVVGKRLQNAMNALLCRRGDLRPNSLAA